MKSIKHILFCLIGILVSSDINSDNHWEKVEYKTIKIKENIYAMIGQGGNLAVFTGKDGTFLIDDQFAPLTEKILKEIKKIGGEKPKFLINTHWHFDHTGGNENFGKKGTIIVAHDNVRKLLATDNTLKAFNKNISATPKEGLPIITFSKDTTFHINAETVRAFHVHNAHTNGDSIVHFNKANIIHAGDIWFNGFYPFIDVEHGGSLEGMITATTTIMNMSDENTIIIPGHGPVGNKQEITEYRKMLMTVFNVLRDYKKQGKTLEEVIKAKPTEDYDPEWGDGFLDPEQWIVIVYSGLEAP